MKKNALRQMVETLTSKIFLFGVSHRPPSLQFCYSSLLCATPAGIFVNRTSLAFSAVAMNEEFEFSYSSQSCSVSSNEKAPMRGIEKDIAGSQEQLLYDRLHEMLRKLKSSASPSSRHDNAPRKGSRPVSRLPMAYNKLMKAFAQVGELDEVLELAQEMKQSNNGKLDVFSYNTVMNALVEANYPQQAQQVFDEMTTMDGVVPNVSSYNILVKLYSICLKEFDSVYILIKMMTEHGCSPDSITFSTLITGLCKARRVQEARGVLDWMLQEKEKFTPVDAYTFTPIVQFYCSQGKIEEAKQLMINMESFGIPPNCVTYNILVKALCKAGSFEEVERILRESSLRGWKPDDITYNTYMDGLCKGGKSKVAYKLLGMMQENGICPDKVTVNILIDCLCHEFKFFEATYLLQRSLELDLNPGVAGYNNVMNSLCKVGRWSTVLKLLTDMIKKGVDPNVRTHNIVIHSLCKVRKLNLAMRFLENRGFISDASTYNTLIHWCFEEGMTNEALHLFYDMVIQKQIAPDLITHSSMVHGLFSKGKYLEATDYFLGYLKEPLLQNIFPYLFEKLLKYKRFKEILHLFEGMVRDGHDLDGFVFHSVITLFCSGGFCGSTEMHYVCLVLDRMLALSRHDTCLASTLRQLFVSCN